MNAGNIGEIFYEWRGQNLFKFGTTAVLNPNERMLEKYKTKVLNKNSLTQNAKHIFIIFNYVQYLIFIMDEWFIIYTEVFFGKYENLGWPKEDKFKGHYGTE